ncbi:hypothetical protein [Dapis sp. BLCC M229]|uniref:hypothetical protein n=1 Tax=Dapis sp. BLCC M229 TaxID=3400188 RepID=UPI003CF185C7
MRDLSNVPIHLLDHEHYRQMLVRDGQRRFNEWHTEYLRYQQKFLQDQQRRILEIEKYNKRRFQESRKEFLRYQNKFLNEMRRY